MNGSSMIPPILLWHIKTKTYWNSHNPPDTTGSRCTRLPLLRGLQTCHICHILRWPQRSNVNVGERTRFTSFALEGLCHCETFSLAQCVIKPSFTSMRTSGWKSASSWSEECISNNVQILKRESSGVTLAPSAPGSPSKPSLPGSPWNVPAHSHNRINQLIHQWRSRKVQSEWKPNKKELIFSLTVSPFSPAGPCSPWAPTAP